MTEIRTESVRLVIGPNASMSRVMALCFFASISVVTLGLALALAAQGYWPVLPFAGLELSALAAALWVSLRRNAYREVIRVDAESVRVEFGTLRAGAQASCEVSRSATRAWLEQGPYRNSPSRLILSGNGQRIELGRCLTDDERAALCRRLKEVLHPGWVPRSGREAGDQPVSI